MLFRSIGSYENCVLIRMFQNSLCCYNIFAMKVLCYSSVVKQQLV